METNAEKLQRALDSAKMVQGILDAELESGADTAQTRRDLDFALARVGSVQKKIEEERRLVEQAEAEARTAPSQEAKALASEANDRLLADVHDVLAGLEQAPPLPLAPAVAEEMLKAKARTAGKAAELQAARDRLASLEERHQRLSEDRKIIVTRRAQGVLEDSDGQTLALLAADLEGLDDLGERLSDEIADLDRQLKQATVDFAQATQDWRVTVHRSRAATFDAIRRRLEAALDQAKAYSREMPQKFGVGL